MSWVGVLWWWWRNASGGFIIGSGVCYKDVLSFFEWEYVSLNMFESDVVGDKLVMIVISEHVCRMIMWANFVSLFLFSNRDNLGKMMGSKVVVEVVVHEALKVVWLEFELLRGRGLCRCNGSQCCEDAFGR